MNKFLIAALVIYAVLSIVIKYARKKAVLEERTKKSAKAKIKSLKADLHLLKVHKAGKLNAYMKDLDREFEMYLFFAIGDIISLLERFPNDFVDNLDVFEEFIQYYEKHQGDFSQSHFPWDEKFLNVLKLLKKTDKRVLKRYFEKYGNVLDIDEEKLKILSKNITEETITEDVESSNCGLRDLLNEAKVFVLEGETQKAREHYQRAIDTPDNAYDLSDVAFAIANKDLLGDEIWAREIFHLGIYEGIHPCDLSRVACDIVNGKSLGDESWARELFQKAIETAGDPDESWARELYKKAAETSEVPQDPLKIANDMIPYDLAGIASDIGNKNLLNDKDWARRIFQLALDKTDNQHAKFAIARDVASDHSLGDKKWSRELFQQAIDSIKIPEELKSIADFIEDENGMDDKKWADEVRHVKV